MIRLIGGPARCGKSTLFHAAEAKFSGQAISLDNLRSAFIAIVSETMRRTLLLAPKESEYCPDDWTTILRQKDRPLWDGARAYIEAAAMKRDDVLMEGGLWPDYVSELKVAYRAVFLVDTSLLHINRVIVAARDNHTHNNWMSTWTDERLTAWAVHNIARSERIKELAQEYDQPVFDIADHGIQEAQDAALEVLSEVSN